jgi:hypothetical protein
MIPTTEVVIHLVSIFLLFKFFFIYSQSRLQRLLFKISLNTVKLSSSTLALLDFFKYS